MRSRHNPGRPACLFGPATVLLTYAALSLLRPSPGPGRPGGADESPIIRHSTWCITPEQRAAADELDPVPRSAEAEGGKIVVEVPMAIGPAEGTGKP